MRSADEVQKLPKDINMLTLKYARLITATMSAQTLEVFPDGALCDRQIYNLLDTFRNEAVRRNLQGSVIAELLAVLEMCSTLLARFSAVGENSPAVREVRAAIAKAHGEA
jgi:hypothetical protein